MSGSLKGASARVDWLSQEPLVGVLREDASVWLVHQLRMSSLELVPVYDLLRSRRLAPLIAGRFKSAALGGVRVAFVELESV